MYAVVKVHIVVAVNFIPLSQINVTPSNCKFLEFSKNSNRVPDV